MQNKNYKYIDLVPKREPRVTTGRAVATPPIIKSRSKYNENTKVSSSHNLVVPFDAKNVCSQIQGPKIDEKLLEDWHTLMLQTFERFLFQLDELFMNLRTEERFINLHYLPILNSYKDICEKLRIETLIAIDKLELTNAKGDKNERDVEFLDKMSVLKTQLSQIRWQYHQAIQGLNVSN